jgi:hypothetical protein
MLEQLLQVLGVGCRPSVPKARQKVMDLDQVYASANLSSLLPSQPYARLQIWSAVLEAKAAFGILEIDKFPKENLVALSALLLGILRGHGDGASV